MEYRTMVIFLWLLFGIATATEVQLSSVWKNDFGWVVTCSWELLSNDSLQSVRLYKNEHQFLIIRPENDDTKWSRIFSVPDNVMEVNCAETQERGVRGQCVATVELYQPQKDDFTYACEVSGERPSFRLKKKDIVINAFVPPTDAVIEATSQKEQSNRVALNCTSSGMPTPNLVWTIGELKVPHDFTDSYWNVTSKLWHIWSQMSYTPSDEHPSAICTPDISHGGQLERGTMAEFLYNSASSIIVLWFCIFARPRLRPTLANEAKSEEELEASDSRTVGT